MINVRRNPKDIMISACDMIQKIADAGHSYVNPLNKDDMISLFMAGLSMSTFTTHYLTLYGSWKARESG